MSMNKLLILKKRLKIKVFWLTVNYFLYIMYRLKYGLKTMLRHNDIFIYQERARGSALRPRANLQQGCKVVLLIAIKG